MYERTEIEIKLGRLIMSMSLDYINGGISNDTYFNNLVIYSNWQDNGTLARLSKESNKE